MRPLDHGAITNKHVITLRHFDRRVAWVRPRRTHRVCRDEVSKLKILLRTYTREKRIRGRQIERLQGRIAGRVVADAFVQWPTEVHATIARNSNPFPGAEAHLADVKRAWPAVCHP